MSKLIVLGIDGAAWKIIKPNLSQLPHFKKLMEEGNYRSLFVEDVVLSPAIWCTIFSGKTAAEHGHKKFVVDEKLLRRKDIKVDFVWDMVNKDYNIKVLQVPFIMPPYNFNCHYDPVEYGASYDLNEIGKDMDNLTIKALEILQENPDIFIIVYNTLDRLQHFHWGEPIILPWYQKVDKIVGMLSKYAEKLIIVSDHGFCSRGEARVQTLPDRNSKGEPLKGDHHEQALLIIRNIDYPINEHKDIFNAILKEVSK